MNGPNTYMCIAPFLSVPSRFMHVFISFNDLVTYFDKIVIIIIMMLDLALGEVCLKPIRPLNETLHVREKKVHIAYHSNSQSLT